VNGAFDWRWPAFFTRVTAGLLFGMAGVGIAFDFADEPATGSM
jgi:hypothetical protein